MAQMELEELTVKGAGYDPTSVIRKNTMVMSSVK
jgi:hypothetical protein